MQPETALARDRRLRWLSVAVAVGYGLLLGRLLHLQVFHGEHYFELSQHTRLQKEILVAPRGRILDREGRVLAENRPAFDLRFDPMDPAFRGPAGAGRLEATLGAVAEVLGMPVAELRRLVREGQRTEPVPITIARDLDFAQLSALEERVRPLPGISIASRPQRHYPRGSLAAHVLGYLGAVTREEIRREPESYHAGSLVGRAGLERTYERWLRGRDGITYMEVDALGRKRNIYEGAPGAQPVPGRDLVTTLDLELQSLAEAIFDSLVPRLRHGEGNVPPAGGVIVMEVASGAILAMVSRPAFRPGDFVSGLSREEWRRLSAGHHPLLNRMLQGRYPPGSVFKPLTALLALQRGILRPESRLDPCWGSFRLGGRRYRCWKREGHGRLDLTQALAQSCDVYFYQVGRRLGFDALTQGARELGLQERTGIDLAGEVSGWIPSREDYRRLYGYPPGPGVVLNLAIGQGELLFTPLELAVAFAALAREGSPPVPHLALDAEPEAKASWRVSPQHLAFLLAALEEAVQGRRGTARAAQVEGFRVAGKTGTAQNPHGEDHALFVALAPADDPQWVVLVLAEEAGHGGAVAAPVAQPILRWLLERERGEELAAGGSP
jgi:penicillin-binding protein 2